MGLLLVNTGDGKGKTTAALGMAFRNVGHGRKVFFLQFIKGDDRAGEYKAVGMLAPYLELRMSGLGFLPKPSSPEFQKHKDAAVQALKDSDVAIRSGSYGLVVLDELNYAVHFKLLEIDDVLAVLENRPEGTDILVTGRHAHEKLIAAADLVTEMIVLKHPYDSGVQARKGIEY